MRSHQRHPHRPSDQSQLQRGVDFTDACWMNLCAGEGEVPVARKGLWWWEGDVAVVDCREAEKDVTAENYDGEPDWWGQQSVGRQ